MADTSISAFLGPSRQISPKIIDRLFVFFKVLHKYLDFSYFAGLYTNHQKVNSCFIDHRPGRNRKNSASLSKVFYKLALQQFSTKNVSVYHSPPVTVTCHLQESSRYNSSCHLLKESPCKATLIPLLFRYIRHPS